MIMSNSLHTTRARGIAFFIAMEKRKVFFFLRYLIPRFWKFMFIVRQFFLFAFLRFFFFLLKLILLCRLLNNEINPVKRLGGAGGRIIFTFFLSFRPFMAAIEKEKALF